MTMPLVARPSLLVRMLARLSPRARDRHKVIASDLQRAREAAARADSRVLASTVMADWLAARSAENHIAAGILAAFDHPRKDPS